MLVSYESILIKISSKILVLWFSRSVWTNLVSILELHIQQDNSLLAGLWDKNAFFVKDVQTNGVFSSFFY